MEAYLGETREILRGFRNHSLTVRNCIAALDAALATLIPTLEPNEIPQLRAILAGNKELMLEEIANREIRSKSQAQIHRPDKKESRHRLFKLLYIECKYCGLKTTLQTYAGPALTYRESRPLSAHTAATNPFIPGVTSGTPRDSALAKAHVLQSFPDLIDKLLGFERLRQKANATSRGFVNHDGVVRIPGYE